MISLVLFAAVGAGLLSLRLSRGPIEIGMEQQVASALQSRVKHGLVFSVGGTDVESSEGRPSLVVKQLLVKDSAGRQIIRAPQALMSVDPLQLLRGAIVPNRLDLRDLTVKLAILPDGDIAFSAGTDETLPFRVSEAMEGAAPGPVSPTTQPAAATPPAAPPATLTSAPLGPDVIARLAASLGHAIDQLAGTDEAFGGFDRMGIAHGTLILDDRSHNAVTSFRNLELDFDKIADGAARMTLAADGAQGRWSITVRGTRHADAKRSFAVDFQGLTLADLQVIPKLRDVGFDTDIPVSGSLNIGLDDKGALIVARGQLRGDAGFLHLHDPDHEPVLLDSIDTSFHLDTATRRIVIDPSSIRADQTSYNFRGEITPPAQALTGLWAISAGGNGTFGAERPGEKPIAFNKIGLAASIDVGHQSLQIDNLSLAGPQVAAQLSARIENGPTGVTVKSKITAGRMPAPVMLRLWPSMVSADVRSWLLANLQSGTVERGTVQLSLDEADLAKMKLQRSVADSHLQLDYAVSDVVLGFLDGVPPLRGVSGTGVVTGDTSKFFITKGFMEVSPGRQLAVPQGSLIVPSTDPKPTPAIISAQVVGPIDVLTELLQRDALKGYAGIPPDAANAKGQIDGTMTVGLKLGRGTKPDDLKLAASARLTSLSIEKLVGKQNLTGGDIQLTLDKSGLRAKGEAQILGATTNIDIRKPAGTDPGQADIALTLDDAARAKAGFNLGKTITGPITAHISTVLGGSGDKKAAIELDLTRATLTNPMPGLTKASGKPGKVTLVATQKNGGVSLDNIACDIGSFALRGSADLDADGDFQGAKLSQLRLSPSDDMKVDVTPGDVLKVTVRGVNVDARPFLKSLSSADAPEKGGKDFDLDLRSNLVTGQNSQVLTGVDLHLSRRGGDMRRVQMNGKFGRAPFTIGSSLQGSVLSVVAKSADAGTTLLFLDLYKKVSGGQLDATIRMFNNRMDGIAVIHNFELREDPAMKRLTEESQVQRKSGNVPIDGSNLAFTKLGITFAKTGSRIDVKDGALFSPQLGATVQGTIDFGRDKLALGGTFVPLYGVNNLFSQLPIVGPILGGGVHEGLFGLNYRISGQIQNPNLTVDPLSALAPGFLRNIFGAISNAAAQADLPDSDKDQATGATQTTPFDPVAR